jgi:hypothetical protein
MHGRCVMGMRGRSARQWDLAMPTASRDTNGRPRLLRWGICLWSSAAMQGWTGREAPAGTRQGRTQLLWWTIRRGTSDGWLAAEALVRDRQGRT